MVLSSRQNLYSHQILCIWNDFFMVLRPSHQFLRRVLYISDSDFVTCEWWVYVLKWKIFWFFSWLKNAVVPETEALIKKCSPAHQVLYRSVIGVMVNQTKPYCDQPAMDTTRPQSTCRLNEAYGCYLSVFPYMSGVNVPQEKLCR